MTDFKETIAYLTNLFYPLKTHFFQHAVPFPNLQEIDGIKIKCAYLGLQYNAGILQFNIDIRMNQDTNLNNFSHKSSHRCNIDIILCSHLFTHCQESIGEAEFKTILTRLLTDALKKIEDIRYNPITDYFEMEDTTLLIPCFQELHSHLKKNATNLTLNDIECSVCYKLTTLRVRRCDHTLCRNCAWKLREKCEPAGQGRPKCPICRIYMDSDDDSDDDNNDY